MMKEDIKMDTNSSKDLSILDKEYILRSTIGNKLKNSGIKNEISDENIGRFLSLLSNKTIDYLFNNDIEIVKEEMKGDNIVYDFISLDPTNKNRIVLRNSEFTKYKIGMIKHIIWDNFEAIFNKKNFY